jgi:hypothetical protein
VKKLAMVFVVGFGLMFTGCPQETPKEKAKEKPAAAKTVGGEEKTGGTEKPPEEPPKAPEKEAK